MALIVFLRGINVGGHRTFRPSMLARDLAAYDVVNVGAAGTFVVRKPGSRTKFLAELRRKLPFETEVAFCDASDLLQLELENPFGTEPLDQDLVRFVSVLSKTGTVSLPITFSGGEEWFVRIIGSRKRLVYGVYRPYQENRISWSDRGTLRCTCDNTQLEDNDFSAAGFERRRAGNQGNYGQPIYEAE